MLEGYHAVEPFIGTLIINTLKKKNQKLIIFDCDGTILDTFDLIEKTVFKTFEEKLPNYNLTLEEAHAFFGPLIDDSFKKYANNEEEVKELVRCYREINTKIMPEYIKAYDGIENVLIELKKSGFKIAIVSNKTTDAVVLGLKICKINQYFDLVIGAEKMANAKPAPDGITQALKLLNKKDAILIGDTIIDIETGKNASIDTIGVTWCKTTKEEFKRNKATYIINRPDEILKIVKE
jgi:HAD superfamily hydrolase (TIGR01549 family)